jgi:hypothetical protein
VVQFAARARGRAVELSDDARFRTRIVRLAATSVFGLAAIALLARATLDAPAAVDGALFAGWVTMPALLLLSLRRPSVRWALVVPSALVGVGLLGVCAVALPDDAVAAAGWLLVTAGTLLGGVLGAWFWFRLAPVPAALDDPFAPARWALVTVHVTLLVAGLVLVAIAAA